MKRKFDILKLVVNILCFGVAALVVGLVMISGIFDNIKHAIPTYICLVLVLGGIPAIMATGNRMVKKQDEIISVQVHHNCPINFSKKAVIIGLILMFLPLYLICGAFILIPHGIFAAFLIAITVMLIVLSRMKEPMLQSFKIAKWKYRLCHIGAYIISIAIGAVIKVTVILPLVEKM